MSDNAIPNSADNCSICGRYLIGKPRMCSEHGRQGVDATRNRVEIAAKAIYDALYGPAPYGVPDPNGKYEVYCRRLAKAAVEALDA